MINVYATPYQIKEFLIPSDISPTINSRDDDLIKRFSIQASRRFDTECKRSFYPQLATKYFDHPTEDDTRLKLNEDLLEISTFKTNNGAETVSSTDYFLMTGCDYNTPPYDTIALKSDGSRPNLLYSGTIQQANELAGYWGYHEDWSNAWIDSQDEVEDNPLSDSATTITVNNADDIDYFGITPRFQEYQLIRIESEYCFITDINAGLNTLTVIRGVNGTTAASHVQNTTIEIYQPMFEVNNALLVLASYAYRRKDSIGSPSDRAFTAQSGVFVMPSKLPDEVWSMIKAFKSVK